MTIEKVGVSSVPEASGMVSWFVHVPNDPNLFVEGGMVVAATVDCSRLFIAGKLECRDVNALTADLKRRDNRMRIVDGR